MKRIDRTGEMKLNNDNELMTIIKYINARDITVQFEDGNIYYNRAYKSFTKGNIINKFKRVAEVGFNKKNQKMTIIEYIDSGNITVEVLGNSYGYSQYWGDTEAMVLDYTINSKVSDGEIDDEWTGTAKVSLSTTSISDICELS